MSYDPRFLAHAVALEEEAMTRYGELADTMATHNNPEVAAFFSRMSAESARHLAEVRELAGEQTLPTIPAWDFDWPGDAPESASYEALHYRMDLRSAIALALENEHAAESFYRQAAANARDAETAKLALSFAEEEADHARLLRERLETTPEPPPNVREDDDPAHIPE